MIEIEYKNLGFMDDASYSFHFHNILQEYDGEFVGAEKVVVEFEEIPYAALSFKREDWLKISEDRTEVTINFSTHRYYDNRGRQTEVPSPTEICTNLHNLMKRAVDRYNKNE